MAGLDLMPGSVLAGKYRVERLLGQGGMGLVVGARHLHLDEPVAIKVLRDELAREPAIVERFLREARAAAKIKSRYVVRVTDADRLPSGAPYLVMEWLEGSDLASIVEREGPLDAARAARHVVEACESLGEAHALGIVHRDLKPSNLFVAHLPDGSICTKILDFGISKLLGEELTGTGNTLGTPSYMAPEQMMSARNVDARADIWAMGVVLYKLVTGTVPFRASTPSELGMKVLFGEPTPPEQARPDLPPGLAQVILRCLRREPAQRFATAAQLAAALAPFAGDAGAQTVALPAARERPPRDATPGLAPAAATPQAAVATDGPNRTLSLLNAPVPRPSGTPPPDATPSPTTDAGDSARRPGPVVAALAATALAAAAGLALWARGAPSTPETTAPPSAAPAAIEPAPAAPDPAPTAEPSASVAPSPGTPATPNPAAPSPDMPAATSPAASAALAAPSAAAPAAPSARTAPRQTAATPRAPAATGERRTTVPGTAATPRAPAESPENPFGGRRK
ncbi:protein kinase domain-containing protein [Sorangium sp. So ce131]|uniref:serine/threonine-protein kinase n=1 Tax=Sorangium sp. So ce131 TaxID=3133282 RepID=UPI003F5FD663